MQILLSRRIQHRRFIQVIFSRTYKYLIIALVYIFQREIGMLVGSPRSTIEVFGQAQSRSYGVHDHGPYERN